MRGQAGGGICPLDGVVLATGQGGSSSYRLYKLAISGQKGRLRRPCRRGSLLHAIAVRGLILASNSARGAAPHHKGTGLSFC
jgi:hypothetical protein